MNITQTDLLVKIGLQAIEIDALRATLTELAAERDELTAERDARITEQEE